MAVTGPARLGLAPATPPTASQSSALVALLMPSRGRPRRARASVLSALGTAERPDAVRILVGVEPEEAARYREVFGSDPARIHPLRRGGNYVRAMRELCREIAADVYGLLSDDFSFDTPGWDRQVRMATGSLRGRIGLVYGDDGYQGERLATAPFLSREWIAVAGDVLVGDYEHLWCDTELTDIARRAGRLVYLPHVRITHNHPLAGRADRDASYDRSSATHRAGQMEYYRREGERRRLADRLAAAARDAPGPSAPTPGPSEVTIDEIPSHRRFGPGGTATPGGSDGNRPTGPREFELLVACARTVLDDETRERIATLLREQVDWTVLRRMALRHDLLPLLGWHLSGAFPDAVPRPVLEGLRAEFRATARRNLGLAAEMKRLVTLFEAGGIPAIPYEGPLLATVAYGNLALRTFFHLDVLIPRRHVLTARELLVRHRYRPEYRLAPPQESAFLRSACELNLLGAEGDVRVELHWQIVPRYFSLALDPEPFWERTVPLDVTGFSFRSLSPEDLVLTLCAHGTRHGWSRLEWIASLAELVRRPETVDWDHVVGRATRLGARRMLAVSLCLAGDLLAAPLPTPVRELIDADPAVRPLARQVATRLFQERDRPAGVGENARFHLCARERARDRLRYVARFATTPGVGDRASLGLPTWLAFLRPILRPVRLLRKFGLGPARDLLASLSDRGRSARATGAP